MINFDDVTGETENNTIHIGCKFLAFHILMLMPLMILKFSLNT